MWSWILFRKRSSMQIGWLICRKVRMNNVRITDKARSIHGEQVMNHLGEPDKAIRLVYICTEPTGLHARPAGQFAKAVGAYASSVTVVKGEEKADASSILSVLSLGIREGDRFEVIIEGPDQDDAASAADAFLRTMAQRAREVSAVDGKRPIRGTGGSGGIAIGPLYLYQKISETMETDAEDHPADPQQEWERFLKARAEAVRQLHTLEMKTREEGLLDAAQLLEAHQMMAVDQKMEDSVKRKIFKEGMRAEKAVEKTAGEFAAMLNSAGSAYLHAREEDVRDVMRRIMAVLTGSEQDVIDSPVPVILYADELTPGEFIQMDRHKIMGLILSGGSVLGHTAILARTMGIPVVFGAGRQSGILSGQTAILDGDTGSVIMNPDDETLDAWRKRLAEQRAEEDELKKWKGRPSITQDGIQIRVLCNIQLPQEVSMALDNDAEGIGLFRSEFLFLGRKELPPEEEQYEAYRFVLEQMQGREVTIRTMDIGGDKNIDCLEFPKETNPVPRNRALQLCFSPPEIFRTQLRALYRASAHGNLRIMFPMVTSVWEVREARRICEEVQAELAAEGIPYDHNVQLGIMIETPAAALTSDLLAKEADFFSCGTNDLTQYTLACDRQNAQLSRYVNAHHPAVLRLLKTVCDNAHQHGITVGICGELAEDPAMTEHFARIGIDELSVPPGSVLRVRRQVREIHV